MYWGHITVMPKCYQSRRSLKRDTRSLALLQSATLPRCLSAGRSRSSDHSAQYSAGYGSDELARWKTSSSNNSSNMKKASIPEYRKSREDLLSREFDVRKKHNLTTTARPFHYSTENLLPTDKVINTRQRPSSNHVLFFLPFYSSRSRHLNRLRNRRHTPVISIRCQSALGVKRFNSHPQLGCVHQKNDRDPASSLMRFNLLLRHCNRLVARIKLQFLGGR